MKAFEDYVTESEQWALNGWDFSYLKDRWIEQSPRWDYRAIVSKALLNTHTLLDMGTGGGEFLASLPNHPKHTFASEAYPPNVPVARERLEPLNIKVAFINDHEPLPYDDNQFDLIISRHESFDAHEVARILKPKGRFITQQVGGLDNAEINKALGSTKQMDFSDWTANVAAHQLIEAGMSIRSKDQEKLRFEFLDIGALLIYLKAIPQQVPDYTLEKYEGELREIHLAICQGRPFITSADRFFVEAIKP